MKQSSFASQKTQYSFIGKVTMLLRLMLFWLMPFTFLRCHDKGWIVLKNTKDRFLLLHKNHSAFHPSKLS